MEKLQIVSFHQSVCMCEVPKSPDWRRLPVRVFLHFWNALFCFWGANCAGSLFGFHGFARLPEGKKRRRKMSFLDKEIICVIGRNGGKRNAGLGDHSGQPGQNAHERKIQRPRHAQGAPAVVAVEEHFLRQGGCGAKEGELFVRPGKKQWRCAGQGGGQGAQFSIRKGERKAAVSS